MTTMRSVLLGIGSVALALSLQATTVSTGNLGNNVIRAAGAYTWSPTATSPSNELPATLSVTYGLWNDPDVLVHAYLNGTEIGSFLVHDGYTYPGATSNSFNVAGLLVDGVNVVRFDGLNASEGDYVIGSVELNYNLPLPVTTGSNEPVSGPFFRKGTSVLHYTTRTPLTPTDVGSNVTAVVKLDAKEQGHSVQQKFDFTAAHLEPNTEYFLVATRGDEVDASTIGTFTTDKQGRGHVSSTKQAHAQGKKNIVSATSFLPVTDIRTVGIQNAATQVLALAAIEASQDFQYLVKRNLTPADPNGTAAGCISLKGHAEKIDFRLLAGGLSAGGVYSLSLNSTVVETVTADADGRVGINGWPTTAPALLNVRALSLLNGSGNVVLSTTLPK